MPYGSICCTYHQLMYSFPNGSNKKYKSLTKEPTFLKMEVYGNTGQENGPKAEKDKTEERATGVGRKEQERR